MLSFFRSIRRSLINEGKTSKYIRYAVGEFILIVAGILVALQIQTWNEGRKLELDRRELIENLKSDFQINLERLEEGLVRADNHLDQIAAFMLKATREDVDISSREIGEFYEIVKAPLTFEPLLENYRTSVSDGRFNLLGDQQLQELFASFSEANSEFQRLADTAHDDYVIRKDLFCTRRVVVRAEYERLFSTKFDDSQR